MSDATRDFQPQQTAPPEVPDLELIRRVGRGGFGEVWLATNRTTGLLRAVKVIPLRRSGTTDPAGREITSLTRLENNIRTQHPNLLQIHHVGQTSDHLFYVMDPADDLSGGPASSDASYRPATLQERLAAGPLPVDHCARYARQLLTGLAHLHQADMVHRDVKPANCLLVGGQLKLADFGLLAEADPQVSRLGTQKYMPPDGRMDTRADVYAAGLVIYEMLTGLPADCFPHLGERAGEIAESPALRRLNWLVLRACQPDPQRRFQDAGAMLARLQAPQPEIKTSRLRCPGPWIAAVAGLIVLVGLAAAARWWDRRPGAAPPPNVHVNFITEPYEAAIYLDGQPLSDADGNPYTTPCTVPDLPAAAHRVVFRHPRLGDLDAGEIDFARQCEIVARWRRRE